MKITHIFQKAFKNRSRGKQMASKLCQEVLTPLTILSMNLSRITLQYRKNPDLRVSEVFPLFQKMEQNIFRIKGAVNTIADLMYKSEKEKSLSPSLSAK